MSQGVSGRSSELSDPPRILIGSQQLSDHSVFTGPMVFDRWARIVHRLGDASLNPLTRKAALEQFGLAHQVSTIPIQDMKINGFSIPNFVSSGAFVGCPVSPSHLESRERSQHDSACIVIDIPTLGSDIDSLFRWPF